MKSMSERLAEITKQYFVGMNAHLSQEDKTNEKLTQQYQSQLGQQGAINHGNWPANQAVYDCTPNPADYGSLLGTSIPGCSVTITGGTITGITVTNQGPSGYAGIIPFIPQLYYHGGEDRITQKPIENAGVKVGELTGWRIWLFKKGYLESYSAERVYAPGEVMTADPDKMTDYAHAGIWAFKERSRALEKMLDQEEFQYKICGSVKMWGKIIEHELGYRSEFAKIFSLDDIHAHGMNRKDKKELLQELRETYGLAG